MATISAKLLTDTGSSLTDRITSIDTLIGIADPFAVITFTINNVTIGAANADLFGAWTFTPAGLADGTHTIVASQPGSSTSLTFTLDTTAAVFAERLVSDTGGQPTELIVDGVAVPGVEHAAHERDAEGGADLPGRVVDGAGDPLLRGGQLVEDLPGRCIQ